MRLDCGLCVLRDWEPSDKESLVRAANNRNVWRNMMHMFPHPYTEADADFWFALLQKKNPRTQWAIEVDGEAVGGIGGEVGEGVYAKSARFGYWLGEPYWGRGIMTSAARAVRSLIEAAPSPPPPARRRTGSCCARPVSRCTSRDRRCVSGSRPRPRRSGRSRFRRSPTR